MTPTQQQKENKMTTAKLKFDTNDNADNFAKAYTKKFLLGHIVYKDTVKIYNVTDETKEWINNYNNTTTQTANYN
jgi:hypothetical protein